MFYKKVIGGNTEECTGNYLSNSWSTAFLQYMQKKSALLMQIC